MIVPWQARACAPCIVFLDELDAVGCLAEVVIMSTLEVSPEKKQAETKKASESSFICLGNSSHLDWAHVLSGKYYKDTYALRI